MPLYVVATPIGNPSDLTPRALSILSSVDVIACEDTRRAKNLLKSLGVSKFPHLVSYFDHNEKQRSLFLIEKIQKESLSVALISDAGTPCLSDPGYRLVKAAHLAKIQVIPIPGACAITALLSVSGLPTDRFGFIGFLPRSDSQIAKEALTWKDLGYTVVFYESASRIKTSLKIISDLYPKALLCVGRELTKTYEEIFEGTIDQAFLWCEQHSHMKGELVLALNLAESKDSTSSENEDLIVSWDIKDLITKSLAFGLSVSNVVALLASHPKMPISRKAIYQIALSLQQETR